jgi:hypothetical protein
MANTYVKIATVTVGSGGAANMTFSTIPSTYTDLVIKLSSRSTFAGTDSRLKLQINSVTTGYSNRVVYGNGTSALSTNTTDQITFFYSGGTTTTASTFANNEIYLPNYAGSTAKSASIDSVFENNATTAGAYLNAGLSTDTAAITSITLTDNGGNFAQYSTATLYGISKS